MAYTFRFYGRNPTDWAEGGNLGHHFDVQFARRPTDAERDRLGELWHAATATGIAEGGPWVWSDRFAAFVVGERWISRGGHIGVVVDFLLKAHAVVPVVDATYLNARAGAGRWDQWSLSVGPPDPGPAFRGRALTTAYQRAVDPSLPAPAPDRSFDAGFARAAAARREAKVEAALATPRKAGKVGLERVDPPERPLPRFDRALWQRFQVPEVRLVDETDGEETYSVHADGDHPAEHLLDRPLAWVVRGGRSYTGVAWLDEAGRRQETCIPGGYAWGLSVSPEGDEVLFRQASTAWHLSLRTGAARPWFHKERQDGYELCSTAFGDGGRWVVLSSKRLRLFQPGEAPRQLAEASVTDALDVRAALGGQVLVVIRRGALSVFACVGDELERIGEFKAPLSFAGETEGGVYLRHGDDTYALTHVEEALERLAPRKPAARPGKPKPALSEAPVDHAPPSEEIPSDVQQALGRGRFTRGPGGRWAVVPVHEQHQMTYFWGLKVRGPDGEVIDHSAAVQAAGGARAVEHVVFSPGGDQLLMLVEVVKDGIAGRVVELGAGGARAVLDNVWAEHGKVRGMAFLAEDEALLLAEKSLRRIRRAEDGTWPVVASLKLSKGWALAVGDPGGVPVAAVVTTSTKPLVLVAAPTGDRLRKLAELTDPVRVVDWAGRSLLAQDSQRRWWRVEQVAEAAVGSR